MLVTNKLAKYFVALILVMGVVLRLVYYFQDYDLIIDEANIARNLAERSFTGLCSPLSYEQYSPPSFLWIEKLMTLAFGFSIMLVWAGIIESFLSQYHEPVIPYEAKIAFGVVQLVLLSLYFSRSGR